MPDDDTPEKISGKLSLPSALPEGTLHRSDCRVELDDGRLWSVRGDNKTRLCTVFDADQQALGWLESRKGGLRQVILPGGIESPVSFEDRLFSHKVWIGDTPFKAVMMLEGRKRVFGDDRIRIEHRDFHSEVQFHCLPEYLVPGVLVAFEIYARPNLGQVQS